MTHWSRNFRKRYLARMGRVEDIGSENLEFTLKLKKYKYILIFGSKRIINTTINY